MRVRRPLLISALAAVIFFLPGCTFGPISYFSISDATLGLQGASAVVPVTVTCSSQWNVAYADATLAQAHNGKLAQGTGGFQNDFPGIPCTGHPQTFNINVFNTSPWVLRTGEAAVTADFAVFKPDTSELVTKSVGPQEIQIVKVTPAPNPVKVSQPARDKRYSH